MKSKRPSLILEVIVALSLAATALTLLAPGPHKFLKRQLQTAKEIETDRIAPLTFLELIPMIEELGPEKIPPAASKHPIKLPQVEVSLTPKISFQMKRQAKVGYLKEHSNDTHRLISCEIVIDKKAYYFYHPIRLSKKA